MYKWRTYYVKVSKYHVFYEIVGNICRKRFIFGGEDVGHGIHAWKRGQSSIFCAMFVSEISVSNDDYLSNVYNLLFDILCSW